MNKIIVSQQYDYIGVFLTNKCHLSCPYCTTLHYQSSFNDKYKLYNLTPQEWIESLNRLELPQNVPITLQGGEPFLYKGIWQLLENIEHKVDILTALPSWISKQHFLNLKKLEWNKRTAPYPTIRVSYHKGQNDYRELIERIAALQEILNIGLYYLEHPLQNESEIIMLKEYAKKNKVELRSKEFLGEYNGKVYGSFLYPDAVRGKRKGIKVLCKNTVIPIAPDGTIYRCHSDLYFNRKNVALGNIHDAVFKFPDDYLTCNNYGLCNACDIKIKTNHYQRFGYTSVNIKFLTNRDE